MVVQLVVAVHRTSAPGVMTSDSKEGELAYPAKVVSGRRMSDVEEAKAVGEQEGMLEGDKEQKR